MKQLCIAAILSLLTLIAQAQDERLGPEQPKSGPGGASYTHAAVIQSTYLKGDNEYWLFEPASPKPSKALPVLVLLHGWGGMSPYGYGAWIEHLVRRGNIVIYPRYQASMVTLPGAMTPAAIRSIKHALKQLDGTAHLKADTTRFALAGHSLGGTLAASVAALAAENGLPRPRAVLVIAPGDSRSKTGWRAMVPTLMADYSKIPKGALLVVMVAEEDRVVGDVTGKAIFNGATKLNPQDKNLVILRSDRRGRPALVAGHRHPFAPDRRYKSTGKATYQARSADAPKSPRLNAHDFFGNWKLFDALCDAAFDGKNRKYALGNTAEQRFLGKWSDGTPVKPLEVILAKTEKKKEKKKKKKLTPGEFY